jgi:hypothetical protein
MKIYKSQLKKLIEQLLKEDKRDSYYSDSPEDWAQFWGDDSETYETEQKALNDLMDMYDLSNPEERAEYQKAVRKIGGASVKITDDSVHVDTRVRGNILVGYRSISGPDFNPGDGAFKRGVAVFLDDLKELYEAINDTSNMPIGDAGHAFIRVTDKNGVTETFSGKSGIVFGVSDLLKRFALGRDIPVDEKISKLNQLYKAGKIAKDELKEVLETASWGPLRKLKNWEDDHIDKATAVNYIMPIGSDTQKDLDQAIDRIRKAYASYDEDVPYDPLPGTANAGKATRNSNSFAYTLGKVAVGSKLEERAGSEFNSKKLPGWGKLVPGLDSPMPPES